MAKIFIKADNFKILYRENYEKLAEQSRIIWWKGNELGYNDNIYNSDDLLHDLYFSLQIGVSSGSISGFNNLNHFFAFCYVRMRSLYYNQLRKKWNRSKLEKKYFKNLGYTYEKADIFNNLFDYEVGDNLFLRHTNKLEILNCINEIKNEENKRILNLKLQEATNESICKYFRYTRSELRSKLHSARKKTI